MDKHETVMRLEKEICSVIYRYDGIKATEIANILKADKAQINSSLYSSPLLHELCYRDDKFRWHSVIHLNGKNEGLREFAGYYSTVCEFIDSDQDTWLSDLKDGCIKNGRNLNDTRGLIHSFIDCRQTMLGLFDDLYDMTGHEYLDWELAFELRMDKGRMLRIYSDVILISGSYVFAFEFKMNNRIEQAEMEQAIKYVPFLDIIFGGYRAIIPVLVLTKTTDIFEKVTFSETDTKLMICSGNMLFNTLNEYYHFLEE